MPFIETGGKRIFFVHIPKTGGQTVEAWLAGLGPLRLHSVGLPAALNCTPQHLRWLDVTQIFGEDAFDYAFAVVRNPFARLESEYRMAWIQAKQGFFRAAPRFSLWLEQALDAYEDNPFSLDNHLRPSSAFLGREVEVFRFEDGLAQAVASVAERTGLAAPAALPHENASAGFEGEIRWDIPLVDRVAQIYADDLRRFGYVPPEI
ncbi:sulfotransferase family 2 domain-containing protein [Poseidonocella sp. HB161398]|uniref:sulfotransferase family 2 domain-containing protein n=1 Tax=Poseidonocella sp. HB161398 TaxID=2320855 RepID=UPI0011098049|nr:sulfotransferase family 2 domain-containing protein [Poseidonocella sp. HB161398]